MFAGPQGECGGCSTGAEGRTPHPSEAGVISVSAVRFLGSVLGVRGWWSLQGRLCCLTVWVCGVGLGERVLARRCHCCDRGPGPGSCSLVSISWRVKWGSRTGRSQSGLWLHPKPAPSFGYTQVLSLKTGGRCHQIPVPGEQRAPWWQ